MFGTQPLRPTGVIFVPSADVEDIAIEILPTSNVNNGVADAVLANYTSFTYLGVRWTLVPDVTLAPGYAYPVLNRPVGWIWYKPSMDMSGVDTNMRKNEESRYQTKVLAMASPEGYRPFALRVKYDSGVA
jgi:hypothetical protein